VGRQPAGLEKRFGVNDTGQMLGDLGVTAGSTVVDYGCGPSLFTLAAARLVGRCTRSTSSRVWSNS